MKTIAHRRPITLWLAAVCGLILFMVAVGGITRLTESGLSIVDWRPLMGALPPLNEPAWNEAFQRYQAYPEYRLLRPDMTLSEFKQIFFWEYLHRTLGRLLGLGFGVPFLIFLLRGWFSRRYAIALGVALLGGGLQGFMGWFMVKSGLVDNPHVSHFRLAAHLMLAVLLLIYLQSILMTMRFPREILPPEKKPSRKSRRLVWLMGVLLVLIGIQMIYGAFVAGLDAGYMYNTFPRMTGRWIPPGFLELQPAWHNALHNPTTIQFIHRWLGMALLPAGLILWGYARTGRLNDLQRRSINGFGVCLIAQVALGLVTLIGRVPLIPAVLHQVMACLLLGSGVAAIYFVRKSAV